MCIHSLVIDDSSASIGAYGIVFLLTDVLMVVRI